MDDEDIPEYLLGEKIIKKDGDKKYVPVEEYLKMDGVFVADKIEIINICLRKVFQILYKSEVINPIEKVKRIIDIDYNV